ncbi:MAG: 3-oxoacyl-ACP synthase [Kofleriaceae bacterium]|nr:3-oxoacyl-ACP synthase [Kofleriaceae bacterium]
MGTHIESIATAAYRGRRLGRGALRLSDRAARRCLRRGHHRADELDLLINAGLYKDHNVAEPALAALIQEDVGANPGHPPRRDHHGTFSFDVLNGACGVLTAVQLIDGMVGPGAAQLGLVVAADADPMPHTSHGFPFAAVGGALLLAHGDDDDGFQGVTLRTFAEDADLFEADLRWAPHAGLTRRGRNLFEVREAPAFGARCVVHAVDVARDHLDRGGLRPADVDLLIASPYPRGFAAAVAVALGLGTDRLPPPIDPALTPAHTAGPIAALDAAAMSGQLARARHVLLVSAGAGITVGVALYRRPAGAAA